VPGPFEGGDLERLRDYQIQEFPDSESFDTTENGQVDWNMARLWQVALYKHNVSCPANIQRIAQLANVYWFLLDVCPSFFNMPRWLAKRTEEQKQATKAAIGVALGRYLEQWGYWLISPKAHAMEGYSNIYARPSTYQLLLYLTLDAIAMRIVPSTGMVHSLPAAELQRHM
jgi:hypothetical protein